jgi:hypothetical protein
MSEPTRWPRPTTLEWTILVIGLILTNHYAWLLDDAFVFFRYVDNWVELGNGLVYNRGEYVEGFSSPGWTLLLAPLRFVGLDYWIIVRIVGLASYATFWWMLVVLNRVLMRDAGVLGQVPPINFPLLYLGLAYAVLCYFTSGVEAPLVQVCAVAYALHLARPERRGPAIWVGLSPLIRPELALALVLVVGWRMLHERKIPWLVVGITATSMGAWLGVRVVYYAELLPNTFYLKDTTNWQQGWVYLHDTLGTYHAYVVALGFGILALLLNAKAAAPRGRTRLGMWLVAAAIALYFVRVGGDPRHYRYLAFPFCLSVAALGGIVELGVAKFAPGAANPRYLGFASAVLALYVATLHPPQLSHHPALGKVRHVMVNGINDAAYHRQHTRLAISPWSFERVSRNAPAPIDSEEFGGVTSTSWCEWAYRLPQMYVVHNLGLTDAILARVEMRADRPAHKSGLQPMARDMEAVHRLYTAAPGMYRLAASEGNAVDWMVRNLDTIDVIEAKMYNRHRLLENLRLALTFPPRIQP